MKPTFRKRKGGFAGILTRSGGSRVNVLIMAGTVGALVLLLAVQGSFFWQVPLSPITTGTGSSFRGRSERILWNNHSHQQHETNRQLLEEQRALFLDELRKDTDNKKKKGLCTYLPKRTSARKLWTRYVGAVLSASQHPDDPNFLHQEWTKKLLSELPPSLLESTLAVMPPKNAKTSTSSNNHLARILEIVRKKLQNPDKEPPLRIAVVGGTFAEGEGCVEVSSVSVPEGSIMANPSFCAWPYRLQGFLRSLMGGMEWVEVFNLSEEGTDTGFMTPLLGNWIYPPTLLPHGPDIVINAYSRYDYVTYGEGSIVAGFNLQRSVQEEMSTFCQAMEASHPCGTEWTPFMIHLDDIGITAENAMIIRYGEAFHRALEADQLSFSNRKEKATNNDNLVLLSETKTSPRSFGMAAHMAMTWVLAFDILEATLEHCKSPPPPPPTVAVVENCQSHHSCPFAFFAGPQQGTVRRVAEFQKYIKPFVVNNVGWKVLNDMSTGWSRKTGLVATAPSARIVFSVPKIAREVRYLHLMTLKSHEEPWKDGKVLFRLAVLPPQEGATPQETSFEITAHHDKDMHVTYHFSVDFQEHKAPVGSNVMLSMELVQGVTFKVLGLMLCS